MEKMVSHGFLVICLLLQICDGHFVLLAGKNLNYYLLNMYIGNDMNSSRHLAFCCIIPLHNKVANNRFSKELICTMCSILLSNTTSCVINPSNSLLKMPLYLHIPSIRIQMQKKRTIHKYGITAHRL